jgi:hypothetical protein
LVFPRVFSESVFPQWFYTFVFPKLEIFGLII